MSLPARSLGMSPCGVLCSLTAGNKSGSGRNECIGMSVDLQWDQNNKAENRCNTAIHHQMTLSIPL